MGADLGALVGRALENTLDAKGLTYAIKDSNEVVIEIPIGTDGTPDLSNAYFVSDAEYQIHDMYITDSHKPREVGGNPVDAFITVKRDNDEVLSGYRAVMGVNTLYALHNAQKLSISDIKFPDANDNPSATAPSSLAGSKIYVHVRVLKLVPA